MKLKEAIQSAKLHSATSHARAKADAVEGKVESAAIPPWPWVVHEERFVAAADGSPVVNMCHPNKAVAKAIAPLLAAAPEMLAALEKMIARWDALDVENLGPGCRAIATQARASIAKAKGSL